MKRMPLLVVLAVVAVVAAGALAWLLLSTESGDRSAHAGSPSAPRTTPAADVDFTEEQAAALAESLTSGDEARVQAAIVADETVTFDPAFVAGLAALDMTIDPDTFAEGDTADRATVRAQVSGDDGPHEWTLVLDRIDGRWLLAETVAVEETS